MIRARLILLTASLFAVVLVVLGFAVYRLAQNNLLGAVDRELNRRAAAISEAWATLGPTVLARERDLAVPNPMPRQSKNVRRALFSQAFLLPKFFLRPHESLFDEEPPWDVAAEEMAWKGRRTWSTVDRGGDRFRTLTLPLRSNGEVRGVVQLAASLADVQAEQERLAGVLKALIPASVVITLLLSILLVRLALRPVKQVAEAAGRIQADRLSERLPEMGRDEIADLSRTINLGLDRLENAFDAQRRFTADASHELKTPLAAAKLRAEMTLSRDRTPEEYRESLTLTVSSIDRMARLVEDLLTLSRSDEGKLSIVRSPTSLIDVAEAAVSELPESGAPITLQVPETMVGQVDGPLMVRLLRILLENACRHTSADGAIVLSATQSAGRIRFTVADTGEGIEPKYQPFLFDRFYRADQARDRGHGGTGLGLAIGQMIAHAHDGRITVQSEVGKGSRFTVDIPG